MNGLDALLILIGLFLILMFVGFLCVLGVMDQRSDDER